MIATKFQPCSLRNYENHLQLIVLSLCCSSLMLSISFYLPITQMTFLTPESLFQPEPGRSKCSAQHVYRIPHFLLSFSALLFFFHDCPAPNIPLYLELPFMLKVQQSHKVLWLLFFEAVLSVPTIFPAFHLFIRISLCEHTCMQGGCFQGYRRGTK